MESQVILSHELVQLHVLSVLPPLLPLVAVVGGDRDVADGGIEPNIEDFVSILFERHGSSPLQVAGNTSFHETALKELVGEGRSILGPVSFNFGFSHPSSELVCHLGKVDKDMLGLLDHGSSVAHLAVRVLQLRSVDELTASVALISFSSSSSTSWMVTDSVNESIS